MTPYEQYRRMIRDLNIAARLDLDRLWQSVRGDPRALQSILPELVQTYGSAAASLSADWYDDIRADSGVRPGFSAVVPEPRELGTSQLIGWARAEATSAESFQTLIEGGMQRRIQNFSRDVVTESSVRDPGARGWMRIGSGNCDFCAMLIGRGAVYTKATADFASHDHCRCDAAPAFAPDQIRAVRDEFVPSARSRSEETKAEDRARVAAWIAENL